MSMYLKFYTLHKYFEFITSYFMREMWLGVINSIFTTHVSLNVRISK